MNNILSRLIPVVVFHYFESLRQGVTPEQAMQWARDNATKAPDDTLSTLSIGHLFTGYDNIASSDIASEMECPYDSLAAALWKTTLQEWAQDFLAMKEQDENLGAGQ